MTCRGQPIFQYPKPTDFSVQHGLQDGADISGRWGQSTKEYHLSTCHPTITRLLCHEKGGSGSIITAEWSWLCSNSPLHGVIIIYIAVDRSHPSELEWEPCSQERPHKYWEVNTQSLNSDSADLLTELLTPNLNVIYMYLWNHSACTDELLCG